LSVTIQEKGMFEKLFQHWCGPPCPRPMLDDGLRQQRLYRMQRAGLPAIAETLLRDGVNERMLRGADGSAEGEESWERPKAGRSTSSK